MITLLILILNLNAQARPPQNPSQLMYNEERFNELRKKANLKRPVHGDLYKYADALYLKADYPKALKYFQKAIQIQPRHAETLLRIGMTQLKLLQWEEAKNAILSARKVGPRILKSSRATLNLGMAYYGLGEKQKAEDHFQMALADDRFLNLKLELAKFYLDFNQLEESKKLFHEILKEFPKSPLPHFNLGMIYYRQSAKENSKKHFNEFLNITRKKTNESLNVKREQAQKILSKF